MIYKNYSWMSCFLACWQVINLHADIEHVTDKHVMCTLQKGVHQNLYSKHVNQKIHDATYEINQACKKLDKHDTKHNLAYPHRSDSVFIVHIDHNFHSWTLYKPSRISYKKFSKLAKKIYERHGLSVICSPDDIVSIANSATGAKYVSLDEFEQYKNWPEKDLQSGMHENIQKMKNYFFWHLQIPTTGLLRDPRFDLDPAYQPIAWHYLLWDLAPRKGQGAHVAIIDTGASAFAPKEKEYTSIYKKNINITAPDNLQDYGYNLVSKDGLDPIRQIMINLANFCDHEKFDTNLCMEKLPEMIIDVVKNKNSIQFEQFFIKNAKNRYLNENKESLNVQGQEVLKSLLYGKYGIAPKDTEPFFHIIDLEAPYNESAILETLPTPKLSNDPDAFAAGHGTFTQGIVNARQQDNRGISGLAPQAQVTMIKAFNDHGRTNKTTLNAALQRAITLKNPIVSMSLKITDEVDPIKDAHLKELIDSIDYVVAASGNDGQLKKLKNKEAYPAKFNSVAFDVGAFSYEGDEYPICPFTQRELNVGPKVVAPGSNLFSAGLVPGQTQDSMYVFMSGTSIAVPVITGFLALVLAEFQDVLSREQILKVLYAFCMKLGGDESWQKSISLGTPDMRSALLCLHVLQALQISLQNNPSYEFEQNFDKLVQAIWLINYYVPSRYEQLVNASCTQNFAAYRAAVQTQKPKLEKFSFFPQKQQDITQAINFIRDIILHGIDAKKYTGPKHVAAHQDLVDSLQAVLHADNYNLFAKLPASAQTRLQGAVAPRVSCQVGTL